jgi:hypothetical protein
MSGKPGMSVVLAALGTAAALSAAEPLAAESGLSRNGLRVTGDAGGFEVFPSGAAAGAAIFCAAGDFARRRLGARATDRVEILHPIGRSRTVPTRRSVVFVLRPKGSGRNTGLDAVLLRPGRSGVSRTVSAAESLCNLAEFKDED